MSGTVNPFGLRMPVELKEWLAQKAEENGRSLNSEIVQRLRESQKKELEQEERKSPERSWRMGSGLDV